MMMMIGDSPSPRHLPNPTVQIPQWDPLDEPHATSPTALLSPFSTASAAIEALHRYLPSNDVDFPFADDLDLTVDAFSCDHFRMYEFKVRRCARARSHDWTECPYAHPGEKARRRDPRRFNYSGTACPDFRKGGCMKGDTCEFAHGVFECWLHPTRYRTQPCKDGPACRRRVCFFAHTPEQLRVLSPTGSGSGDLDFGSPVRHQFESCMGKSGSFVTSPTSILASPPVSPSSESPPMSPSSPQVRGGSFDAVSELVASMSRLQVNKMKLGNPQWSMQAGSMFGSSRRSSLGPGFCNLPSTPTRIMTRTGLGQLDSREGALEEEPAMERVESGRDLRAKMYAKLRKENSLGRGDPAVSAPDFGWVSELVK